MNQATIEKLAEIKDELCISIILPTTKMPDRRSENTIRLNNLLSEAKKSIIGKGNGISEKLNDKLSDNAKEFSEQDLNAGLAIFVSDTISECISLPFSVDEKVAVEDKFRIRDLIEACNESISYYLLVLSESKARLYKGFNDKIEELDRYFPVEHFVAESSVERVESSKPAPRWIGGSSGKRNLQGGASITPGTYIPNMDSIEDERLRKFFREVDTELSKRLRQEERPVILATVENNASVFKAVSENRDSIVQELHGSMDNASEDQLSRLLEPSLKSYSQDRKRCHLAALEQSRNKGNLVSGYKDCLENTRQGRGRTLLIEKDYQEEPEEKVEEILRNSIRTSCEVYFVDKGDLKDHAGMVLITRY